MRAFAIGVMITAIGLIAFNCVLISVVLLKVSPLLTWDALRNLVRRFGLLFLCGGIYNGSALMMAAYPTRWSFWVYAASAVATALLCISASYRLFNLFMGTGVTLREVVYRLRNAFGLL